MKSLVSFNSTRDLIIKATNLLLDGGEVGSLMSVRDMDKGLNDMTSLIND